MDKAVIFCDGASKGNPGLGGWGAVVLAGGHVQELGGAEAHTTNNRMELTAALNALRYVAPKGPASVVVYTDSNYVINGISKWVHGWKKKGWLTKEKKEVLNRDLWEQLHTAALSLGALIDWRYVGGHVGVAGNERVDAIASDFAVNKHVELYSGPSSTYTVNLANIGVDDVKKQSKSKSSERSKAKAYSYISEVGGVVMVHRAWEECKARVQGKKARFKKSLSAEDEKAIVAQFSNAAGH
ncbi:MAG: ribonuclease HI [Patescibacteria group bacterium]